MKKIAIALILSAILLPLVCYADSTVNDANISAFIRIYPEYIRIGKEYSQDYSGLEDGTGYMDLVRRVLQQQGHPPPESGHPGEPPLMGERTTYVDQINNLLSRYHFNLEEFSPLMNKIMKGYAIVSMEQEGATLEKLRELEGEIAEEQLTPEQIEEMRGHLSDEQIEEILRAQSGRGAAFDQLQDLYGALSGSELAAVRRNFQRIKQAFEAAGTVY